MPAKTPSNVSPRRAVVTPRARKAHGGAALPLESLIRSLLAAKARGLVVLTGLPGGGKTTALAHLAAVLPENAPIDFLDEPPATGMLHADRARLTVVTADHPSNLRVAAEYELADWNEDDLVEYLAARHRNRCASVLSRLHADSERGAIGGSPQLWRMILDEMAGNESVTNVSQALRRCLAELSIDEQTQFAVGEIVFNHMQGNESTPPEHIFSRPQARQYLFHHSPVKMIYAAKYLARALVASGGAVWLMHPLPPLLVRETAVIVRQSSAVSQKLMDLLRSADRRTDAMAASILLAADPTWRPWVGRPLRFSEAQLQNASWAKLDLQDCDLSETDLSSADLNGANLNRVEAGRANFCRASLQNASLDAFHAPSANFAGADLSSAHGETPIFSGGDFSGANLDNVKLERGEFLGANFTRASFAQADLRRTVLFNVNVAEAMFIGTNFNGAKLHQAKLREAICLGATFLAASLSECDFEGMEFSPGADFRDADLRGCIFTGTRMPRARFRGADLRDAKLADIDWEGADLRDADLRGASFHLGSTRSGLVPSTTPCEGSRTGFYEDDFNQQDYRAPEEIRKANLCGADLRLAKITGVDFYLVDLRGARYTNVQAAYFKRCGAILQTRAA